MMLHCLRCGNDFRTPRPESDVENIRCPYCGKIGMGVVREIEIKY